MNLVNKWILCILFLSLSNTEKLEQHHGHCHHLASTKKTLPSTKPMGRAHFLAKALYGVNLCLQPKYGRVFFPFDSVHFPSLKSKPLLYYPMIIDRVINRKPIILPQTFQQMGKIFSYLTEMRDYLKDKFHLGNSTFTLLPPGAKIVKCEQQLLEYLYKFQRSRLYSKLKAVASIFIPICIIKMLHRRQTAREEAMCNNNTEFIRLAKNAFYQTTRHPHRHHHHHRHCCYQRHHHHRRHKQASLIKAPFSDVKCAENVSRNA